MDDLSWLDDLPEEWKSPQELHVPTKDHFVNFVIAVLAGSRVSNAIVLAVAELLAAKERFDIWYMTKGKETLDERRLVELLVASDDLFRQCWEAWVEYRAGETWSVDLYRMYL